MALIDRSKNQSQVFKDIALSFVKHPVTNDVGIFSNEDAIRRSVMNLVRTRLGERFYNDLIGTQVESSLFELNTLFDQESIQDDVLLLLENFEPRVSNVRCRVSFPPDTNELNVEIRYDVTGLALPTQNIEFVLQSTRL
tara:strand:- start:3250 stop:3666 length:417 start_codon:yes stop_codon:yes gene_type:complete